MSTGRAPKKERLKKGIDVCFPYAKLTFVTRGASAERWCVRHWVSKVNEKPYASSKILAAAEKRKKNKKKGKT